MISTTTNRVTYAGNGSSATFSYPYEFFAQADLKVYLYNSSLQQATLQTLNTNYTVGGTANAQGVYTQGGSVIVTCAVPSSLMVVITRDGSQVQNYSLLQNGQINSTALVQQLDYVTLLIQRLQDLATRSVRLSEGYGPSFDPTIPPPCLIASTVLIVNSSATGWAVGPTADQITNAQSSAISAALSAVAAAASATTATTQAAIASSSALSASNNAVLAASSALSASNNSISVGSSALSASNSQVLAASSALSASNNAAIAASSALSASNSANIASSSAVSAGNNAAIASSSALSAANSAVLSSSSASQINGVLSLPFTTQYCPIYASSATQVATVVPGTAVGQALCWNGSSAPSFQAISISSGSGITQVANGGTGVQGALQFAVAVWNGSSAMTTAGPSTAGHILQTASTSAPQMGSFSWLQNLLVNSAFDWWQAFPSGSSVINGQQTYFADQWYVNNFCGTSAVITCSKVGSQFPGSLNGCQVQITTAPTAGQANGTELWQVIENPTTIGSIINGSSFAVAARVKALGAVNQIGVQLFQATSEAKIIGQTGSSIAAETLVSVNSAGFTGALNIATGTMNYQAGSSGVVAVRFRITGVQTGSTHAQSNGFIMEQAGLWVGQGSVQPMWSRKSRDPAGEFTDCLRFYERSYDRSVLTGTNVGVDSVGSWRFRQTDLTSGTGAVSQTIRYAVPKRADASCAFFSTDGSSGNVIRDRTNSTNVAATIVCQGQNSFAIEYAPSSAATIYLFEGHWTADARI